MPPGASASAASGLKPQQRDARRPVLQCPRRIHVSATNLHSRATCTPRSLTPPQVRWCVCFLKYVRKHAITVPELTMRVLSSYI